MDQKELERDLKTLSLGAIRYFACTASTNDEAANWLKDDCPDLALVVADEQTAGRGRSGRKWFTPAGSALAFSLVLRAEEQIDQLPKYQNTARLNGLGALAVTQALHKKYQLPAKIKWPNDVLINGKKLAGVLAEAHWLGNQLAAVVLGIGINVTATSVPPDDWDTLNPQPFPATSVEAELGIPVDRWDLLSTVLTELLDWRQKLSSPEFLSAWEGYLALKDQWVQIVRPGMTAPDKIGKIIGLKADGALQIQDESGESTILRAGEIHPADPPLDGFHVRPVDSPKK
jgi:BirA family biotin operon repressor/biotin-[acetyl-CoA-carboxylase] ligase